MCRRALTLLIGVLLARAVANEGDGHPSIRSSSSVRAAAEPVSPPPQAPLRPPRCSDGTPASRRHGGAPPHLVVVMVDDLGLEDLGHRGSFARTPHIDALASRAVHVDRCAPLRPKLA
jgi:hypothetical protein